MFKENSILGGAVVAALLASLCCIGPLLFVVLGLSSFGAATYFEAARPYLMAAAVGLLAIAFYWIYFKRRETACASGEVCAVKPVGRASRIGLWIATLAVLIFASLPYFAGPLAAKISEKEIVDEQNEQGACCVAGMSNDEAGARLLPAAGTKTATFKVEGMTCVSCETTIQLALEQTPGVRRSQVSYDRGEAVVEFDPEKTTPAKLRDAINSTGYTVKEGK